MNIGNDSRDFVFHAHITKLVYLLIQYFYEGLTMRDRSMIDVASGGALVDKTPTEAKNLIANMEVNSQHLEIGMIDP